MKRLGIPASRSINPRETSFRPQSDGKDRMLWAMSCPLPQRNRFAMTSLQTTTDPVPARRAWLRVLAMLFLLGFAFQGTRPLWDTDEGRYTAVALQMIESGDFLVPRLNDHQEHLTKPPLTYWAIAAGLSLFGRDAWGVRIPYALAFVLTGLLVYELGRRYVPERPWLPAFLWGSSLLTVFAANVVSTDGFLILFETLAMYAWVRSRGAANPARWQLLMWAGLGLAFLTKGPPGLLPLLPVALWTALVDGRRAVRALFPPHGLAVFAVVGLGWFAWLVSQRPALFGYFLGYEVFDRVFTGVHDRNAQWYGGLKVYLPILFLAAFPWGLVDLGWLRTLRSAWRRSAWRGWLAEEPDRAFLLMWVLLPLAVFFVAQSRLFLYILPLSVPISLLLGRRFAPLIDPAREPFWRFALPGWVLLVLLAKAGTTLIPSHKDARAEADALLAVARHPDRILFVGMPAHYGLRLYTGAPVEQVDRRPAAQGGQAYDPLDELCRDLREHPDALLVMPSSRPPFDPVAECGDVPLASVQPGIWQARPVGAMYGIPARRVGN